MLIDPGSVLIHFAGDLAIDGLRPGWLLFHKPRRLLLTRGGDGFAAVANALAESEIASEIYSIAGHYDLLVKFYVENGIDIGHFVNEKVQSIPGVQDTYTVITFKAF